MSLRESARQIFLRTLEAIDVETVVGASVRADGDHLIVAGESVELSRFRRILVVAIGKASVPMARSVERILGDRITSGLVVTNALTGERPQRLRVYTGGHPAPNRESLESARAALELLRLSDSAETLVIFLISGGGSAVFESPIDPHLTLEDLREVNRVLVGCGAVIGEINIVRRRLSAVKGGKLADAAPQSRQISLYLSDVNSDDLTTVASGPTLPDPSTYDEFRGIIDRYDLLRQFPKAVADLIESAQSETGAGTHPAESPRRTHHLLMDNRAALGEAARIASDEFDSVVEIAGDLVEGDVAAMARAHLERLDRLQKRNPGRRVCLLSGGEVICPVRGSGTGGRNQEFVLRAALMLEEAGNDRAAVLSAGTDGIDGNSPAAGAISDLHAIRKTRTLGLSPEAHLENSDAFTFFNSLGQALITGPTGNNVRDLRILLSE